MILHTPRGTSSLSQLGQAHGPEPPLQLVLQLIADFLL